MYENTLKAHEKNTCIKNKKQNNSPVNHILSKEFGNQYIQISQNRKQNTSLINHTGIPDILKTKFENISGMSLDDVRVHYNSNEPNKINSLAYTQGNQIYIGCGQERYLKHELGHILQQKQEIVQPTGSINGMPINDSPILEHQADQMPLKNTMQRRKFYNNQRKPVIQAKKIGEKYNNYFETTKIKNSYSSNESNSERAKNSLRRRDKPAFIINSILPYTEVKHIATNVSAMIKGIEDPKAKQIAVVLGINVRKEDSENEIYKESIKNAKNNIDKFEMPIAIVESTFISDKFPYGEMRNDVLKSEANKYLVHFFYANNLYPYISIQDFDDGSRCIPNSESKPKHIFDAISKILCDPNEEDTGIRPLLISGGYRPESLEKTKTKLMERVSKVINKHKTSSLTIIDYESFFKKLQNNEYNKLNREYEDFNKNKRTNDELKSFWITKYEEYLKKEYEKASEEFYKKFCEYISLDMESRDRFAKFSPLLPYSPEPNLFLDGFVALDEKVNFGNNSAEYLQLAHSLIDYQKKEYEETKDEEDSENFLEVNRDTVRDILFYVKFNDWSIETDLSRLFEGFITTTTPQTHNLNAIKNFLFTCQNHRKGLDIVYNVDLWAGVYDKFNEQEVYDIDGLLKIIREKVEENKKENPKKITEHRQDLLDGLSRCLESGKESIQIMNDLFKSSSVINCNGPISNTVPMLLSIEASKTKEDEKYKKEARAFMGTDLFRVVYAFDNSRKKIKPTKKIKIISIPKEQQSSNRVSKRKNTEEKQQSSNRECKRKKLIEEKYTFEGMEYIKFNIDKDGNCLINSVIKFTDFSNFGIQNLRDLMGKELINNQYRYQEFLNLNDLQKYVKQINTNGYWCGDIGDIMPHLLANALNLNIIIFQQEPSGGLIIMQELNETANTKVYVLYNGNHYDALQRL